MNEALVDGLLAKEFYPENIEDYAILPYNAPAEFWLPEVTTRLSFSSTCIYFLCISKCARGYFERFLKIMHWCLFYLEREAVLPHSSTHVTFHSSCQRKTSHASHRWRHIGVQRSSSMPFYPHFHSWHLSFSPSFSLHPTSWPQAVRYLSYQERFARFFQFSILNLIRRLIGRPVIASYVYFGGYVGGSELTPHTDRPACEYTMSLCVDHFPPGETWRLGINKNSM